MIIPIDRTHNIFCHRMSINWSIIPLFIHFYNSSPQPSYIFIKQDVLKAQALEDKSNHRKNKAMSAHCIPNKHVLYEWNTIIRPVVSWHFVNQLSTLVITYLLYSSKGRSGIHANIAINFLKRVLEKQDDFGWRFFFSNLYQETPQKSRGLEHFVNAMRRLEE